MYRKSCAKNLFVKLLEKVMRKSCGYHKSYDELCKKWCVKIIFTNYNFTEIEIYGETNFPKKEKTAVVGNRAPAALLARAD